MEQVILVDKYDCEIGRMEKIKAHQTGCLHRAFSVFLKNSTGAFLFHKRAEHKYHSGGLWANSCDGHPRSGETIIQSAHRRVREELGIECLLFETDKFIYQTFLNDNMQENEFLHVFTGTWNESVYPDQNEISEVRWIKPDTFMQEIKLNEDEYCYWTRLAFARMFNRDRLS